MNVDVLATKLYRPALQPRRVPRPQLVERLNAGLSAGRPLTLISAPAGFGKTTCVGEWLAQLDRPTAWLSLDPSDNDPARFFAYLIAALQQVDASFGQQIEGALRAGQTPPVDSAAAGLIRDVLRVGARFVLVLDDFQVIQDADILAFFEKLVANQPPQLHLALVTREDPLLPLARLRANDRLTEIRSGELRFSGGEVSAFFTDVMPLPLTAQDVRALEARTEGWAAGLQLAGLSLRGRADVSGFVAALSGSHRYILSYLTEEVLHQQPEEIQRFVLQTAMLDALTGALCDAVTGRTDSAEVLERLYRANLFLIPLDDEQRWYRYHHLFADLLRNQLHRLPAAEVAQLHQRARRWYEQAGSFAEAIQHALAGADYDQAVRLLEQHAMRMLLQGYARTVEGWMQAIPVERIAQSARINLDFAWMHLLRGAYARIGPYLEQAEAAIARESAAGSEATRLLAERLALQSNLSNVQGKPQESIAYASQALQAAAEQDHYLRSLAYQGLGGGYRLLGDFPRLSEAYQQAIRHSRASDNVLSEMLAVSALLLSSIRYGKLRFAFEVGGQPVESLDRQGARLPPIAGTTLGAVGVIHYEWNHLDQARRRFEQSAQLSALAGHTAGEVYSRVLMSRLLHAEGDLAAAADSIQQAIDLLPLGIPTWLKPEVLEQQVRILLAQDQPLAARSALQQWGLFDPSAQARLDDLLRLALLRLYVYEAQRGVAREAVAAGLQLASELAAQASAGECNGVALQALILRALLYEASGAQDKALEDVRRALALAEPEGYVRSFVDAGERMAFLLTRCLERSGRKTYVQELLAAFPPESMPPLPGSIAALPEPLSERELEVLRLIAAGMTYGQVAGQLVISLNTVRFHVKVIYSKLGVNNRIQAIEAARQAHLL